MIFKNVSIALSLMILVLCGITLSKNTEAKTSETKFWTITQWHFKDGYYYVKIKTLIDIEVHCSMQAIVIKKDSNYIAKHHFSKTVGSKVGEIKAPDSILKVQRIKGVLQSGEDLFIVPECIKIRDLR